MAPINDDEMTRHIFLHVGMHKTGTTAIQSAFNGFDDGRTQYADLGFENHSIPFYTAFSGHHLDYHIWKAAGLSHPDIELRREAFRERIRRAIIKKNRKNIVFSGEDISLIPEAGIQEFHDILSAQNARPIVLVYVRSPVSFLASDYQQTVKSRQNPIRPHAPQYRNRIEKFLDIFGADNVVVREFNRERLLDGDIVADFSNLIHVKAPAPGPHDNATFSTEAVRVLFQLNLLLEPFHGNGALTAAREKFLTHIRTLLPGRFDIPPELIRGLVDEDDVTWLYEKTSIDFRSPTTANSKFDPEAFTRFVSRPDETTLRRLRDYVRKTCGVPAPPESTAPLIARYFMCFLKDGYPHSSGFDPERYLALNPDVAQARIGAFEHFVRHGFKAGRRT